jgi:DNA-binding NarL/FixJ family response regulator
MEHWTGGETWRGRAGHPTLRAVAGHAVRVLPRRDDGPVHDGLPGDHLPRHPSTSPVPAEDAAPAGIRVLVVADDVLARRGVLAALDDEPGIVVVGEHGPGPAVLTTLTEREPDVLLLHGLGADADAPVLTAIQDLVRRSTRVVRVLHIGVRDGEAVPDAEGSVCGSLPASATPEEVVAAVRVAAAGFELNRSDQPRPPAGDPPRGREVATHDGLSDRECDVLTLVAKGMSNAEIAAALTLSEHTVKSHVRNLLGKLGLRNRTHAVIYAFESGLVAAEQTASR